MKLYAHQQSAIAAATAHFARHDRGKMVMAFRTGKTVTSAGIAERLGVRSLLFAAPTLFLQSQSILEYRRFFPTVPILVVCSDDEAAAGQGSVTTDHAEVEKFLRKYARKPHFVFCTYASSHTIALGAANAGAKFDLGVYDEAHRTVGPTGSLFSSLLYDDNITVRKRLFMTATERFLRSDGITDVSSMDDESLYGQTFYRLPIGEAIERGVLCDYDLVATVVSDAEVRSVVASARYVEDGGAAHDKRIYVAALTALKCLQEGVSKKIIVYFGRVKQSVNFEKLMKRLMLDYPELDDVTVTHIEGGSSNRDALNTFRKAGRAVLTNCLVVREGLDVPDCDTVLFAVPKQGTIEILQMAGRALTVTPGKKRGRIVIPCLVESVDSFFQTEDFAAVKHIVTSMASGDERIMQNFYTRRELPIVAQFTAPHKKQREKVYMDNLLEAIDIRLLRRITARQDFPPFEEARKIVIEKMLPQGVRTRTAYKAFLENTKEEINLPFTPNTVYANSGWVSWTHFLGLTERRRVGYRSYAEARAWVIANLIPAGIDGQIAFAHFLKGGHPEIAFPDYIPTSPDGYYRKTGEWKGWPHFFGRESRMVLEPIPYEQAKAWARANGIKSGNQWYKLPRSVRVKYGLHKTPDRYYPEWEGWHIFLGTGFLPYEQAKAWVRENLKDVKNWRDITDQLPDNIPNHPNIVYKDEWEGWDVFLGRSVFLNYQETKEWVKTHRPHIKGQRDWLAQTKTLPPFIYKSPHITFRGEWKGWPDFLGKK